MNDLPPLGGFGGALNDTAAKLRQIVDLDQASAEDIRRWTLVGIVELHSRMTAMETMMAQQQAQNSQTQRIVLGVGALAWIALTVGAVALARVF